MADQRIRILTPEQADAKIAAQVSSLAATYATLPSLTDTGYDLVLLLGQSNMQGGAGPVDTAVDITHPRIFAYARVGTNASKIVQAVDPLQHPNTGANGGVGPGMSFAHWYADTVPGNRRVLLIPGAYSGSGFVGGNDGARWNPGADFSYNNTANSLYEGAISQAQDALTAAGANSRIVAALWVQGEADGSVPAATYRTYLESLIDGLRSRLSVPNLPFVIGSMVPEYIGTGNAIDDVHQATPSRKPYTSYVRGPSGYLYTGDGLNVHYTAAGNREQGRRLLAGLGTARANATPASAVPANPPVPPSSYVPPADTADYTFASAPTDWFTSPTTTLTASGGNLQVPVTNGYQVVAPPNTINLTARSVTFRLASIPPSSVASSDIYFGVTTAATINGLQDSAGVTLFNGTNPYTDARVVQGNTRVVNGGASGAANRTIGWYRIRSASGTVFIEYSSNGTSWTTIWSGAVTWSLTAVRPFIYAGHWNAADADSTLALTQLKIA